MRKQAFTFACVSLVLTSLLATSCIQSISSTTEASTTAWETPVPAPTQLSPVTTEGVFVLPSPVSAPFQIDDSAVELREYALNLSTQDLSDPVALAPIHAVLNSNRWQPARQSTPEGIPAEEKKQILNAWGFHCENNGLYKDRQLLVQSLACTESDATLNHSRTDFVWFLPVRNRSVGWLVGRNSIDPTWQQMFHLWVIPKFVGDDLLVVHGFSGENGNEVRVERNGQTVYTQTLQGVGDCLGSGIQIWDDEHWGLNTEGDVVIDGELVGQTQGYREAFGLRVVNGKPVYFVAKEQEIIMVFAGQTVPLKYDQIIHTCYPVYQDVFFHLDIGVLPEILWFFAREGDLWYYVEMEFHE